MPPFLSYCRQLFFADAYSLVFDISFSPTPLPRFDIFMR